MLYNITMSYLAYKTKLRINNRAKTLMRQCAGYRRWLWNWGLNLKQKARDEGITLNKSQLRKFYTNHVKPLYPQFKLEALLVRKTLSFSKSLKNHIGAIWYFVHYYNASLPF